MFEGCGAMFPGGKTFMGMFRADQYAEQRQENLYFPWASKQEWVFASWLLRSHLSMAVINSFLSLDIMTRAEILPRGPQWVSETLKPEHPVKQPIRLFYRNTVECLQALLSHPLFEPHISFIPRKVWTSATKICHIYDEWLSGDCAWKMQEALPNGSTLLGVVLSSDKTNISVMSGNHMAHLLLISLANIDARIHSKTSLHAYLLVLNIVLMPLKTAAAVGVMMSDPVGNLCYCFTLIAAYIADTPEESLLAATGPKWCIEVVGADELDFRFSLRQTLVGYQVFNEGISKLKQITGRDHHAVQRYLIGATNTLQEFHDNKDAIVHHGACGNWEIPELELL
ncbi:hypothetical protein V8E55_007198 [Tylopilus felleus]